MTHAVQIFPIEQRDTFWRTLQAFNVTRVVITLLLITYLVFNSKKLTDAAEQLLYWETCVVYLLLAVGFTILTVYYRRRFLLQLWTQIAVDISAISLLYVSAGGAKTGLAILYLFPLAGSAILASLLPALFFVSVVTLFLLADGAYQTLVLAGDPSFSQVGLYGIAFFVVVFAINRLAAKLIKQEALAAERGIDLQIQQAINHLIIADMGDGILVVGRDSQILTANPAAERMLGLSAPYDKPFYKLIDLPALVPIADIYFEWLAGAAARSPADADAATFVAVKPVDDMSLQGASTVWGGRREPTARLKLRFATVETAGLTEDRTVIFLQDVGEIENQAQQLKLASMGRLTASIAHEVRNPLAAISYATSLLSEDTSDSAAKRLLNIVGDNVARLDRMIEDILKLSRKAHVQGEPQSLSRFFDEILGEFEETRVVNPEAIALGEMTPYHVRFDPLHLREVVLNLLSNAMRYASGKRGSIRIEVAADAGNRLELHVQDDGPPISAEVRSHLFEPFYTTSSKGTGLGLYLARELCLNNGATLDYEYRMDAAATGPEEPTGRFVVSFAAADPL